MAMLESRRILKKVKIFLRPIMTYDDEAHHSLANTYQKVMEYFKPKLFLGMTATPDKRDDGMLSGMYTNCSIIRSLTRSGCSRQCKRIYYARFIILELVIFP